LELSDEVYQKLQKAAEIERVTPEEWIDARLPETSGQRPNRDALVRYIGAIDSSEETPDPRYRTEVSDIIAEKLRKQGLNIP
jgi:hypothetical protein